MKGIEDFRTNVEIIQVASSWLRPHSQVARLTIGILAFAAASAAIAFAIDRIHDPSADRAETGNNLGLELHGLADTSCAQSTPGIIAVVGRVAPGRGVDALLSSGYIAKRAIDGAEDDLVVLYPSSGRLEIGQGAQAAVRSLQQSPALASVGLLGARTNDLSLRSCRYRFEDNTAAEELARRTTAWMVANNVLAQAQVDARGTTFRLTEDPTNPSHLFFTVLLAKPTGGGPGSPPISDLLVPYTATVDRATGTVLSAGRAHWYDFY